MKIITSKKIRDNNRDQEQVHIPGYGIASRKWARENAIRKLEEIIEIIKNGRVVPKSYFDLARAFHDASRTGLDFSDILK